MSEQLRCTCGAFEKIEEAWGRIYSFVKDRSGHEGLVFDFEDASLRILNNEMLEEVKGGGIPGQVSMVPQNKFKDFASSLQQLADQIPPSKPKEREWRVGDELIDRRGALEHRYVICGGTEADGLMIQAINYADQRKWAARSNIKMCYDNLTIESEQNEK